MVSVDGTTENTLLVGTRGDYNPVWSPNGNEIIFQSIRFGRPAIWLIRVLDGKPQGEPAMLRTNARFSDLMGFSRTGQLFIRETSTTSDIYIADWDSAARQVTSTPRRLNQEYTGFAGGPLRWSRTGKELAYRTVTIPGTDPFLVTSAGKGLETRGPLRVTPLGWFPDGRSLLLSDIAGKLVRFSPENSDSRDLFQQPGSTVALSHDAKTLFFARTKKTMEYLAWSCSAAPLPAVRRVESVKSAK